MRIKDFLNWINFNDVSEDYEIYVSNNNVSDIKVDDVHKKIIFKIENGLESYYNHKSKMGVLSDMIECIRLDGVIEVSEMEIVEIAHDLELSFEDVANEFKKDNINVEVL